MATTPPEWRAPPPREPWESPPPGGWVRSWVVFAAELGWGLLSVAALLATLYALRLAPQLWHHHVTFVAWAALLALTLTLTVAVWRQFDGLQALLAMLTDWGRVARLRGRPPVWLERAPEPPLLSLVQLSDLHITEADDVRLVERPGAGGNRALPRLLAHPEIAAARCLVITGDVTDRGSQAAWDMAAALLGDQLARSILVPGNHDAALLEVLDDSRPRDLSLRADRFGVVQLANLLKFCGVFARSLGGRQGFVVVDGRPQPYVDAFAAVERRVRPFLDRLPSRPVPPLRLASLLADLLARRRYAREIAVARRCLQRLFPVAVPLDEAVVFVLNSVGEWTRHPFSNALGSVGRKQYARLDVLARFFAQKLRLVALHHHVVRRSEEAGHSLGARLLAKFTVLSDPLPLIRFCRRQRVRAVLHGHRHIAYQLRLPGDTVLLAAPSSTLGDELAQDPRPQFERYQFVLAHDPIDVGIHRALFYCPLAP